MKTKKLEISQIISNIEQGILFEATSKSGSFRIKISKYVPFCCLAIHSGSNLRSELYKKIALNDYQRWYEEDPHTDDFVKSMPITLIANDSRYEYDLNRPLNDCIYTKAWDKNVWEIALSSSEKKQSKLKHQEFYLVLEALVKKIEHMFGASIVYDIHSYNYKRWDRNVPVFNIGTERIDTSKYRKNIDKWMSELSQIEIPDCQNVVAENDVFFGRGYALEFITKKFRNTLVLATEIKKVYCDELTGDSYPKIIRLLQQKLKQAIINTTNDFCSTLPDWHHVSALKLLDKNISSNIQKIDNSLYRLMRKYELLAVVNPINANIEKNRFLKSHFTRMPDFKYNPVKISSYTIKQQLMRIPVQEIEDISIRNMYVDVVNSSFDRIDMISSINTDRFLYSSLRYFGRPDDNDLKNARYIMSLPDIPGEAKREPLFDSKAAKKFFAEKLDEYGFNAKLEISNKSISKIIVLNSKKTIIIKDDAVFKRRELNALSEHEVGVHMLTTVNSNKQNLKIFNLGLPVNTLTQEGLAILSEYLSGNFTLERLKKIALRVLVVDAMCNGADFIECFNMLRKKYQTETNLAFNIVTRIFRAGGFTKDYLYLKGFVRVLRLWEDHNDISALLVGKTSLKYMSLIEEMIEREMINPPHFITKSFIKPKPELNNQVYSYILSGLQ